MKPSEMRVDHVSTVPVCIDWQEMEHLTFERDVEPYYCEAETCYMCGVQVVTGPSCRGCEHRDADPTSTCHGRVDGDGPMMNYWYPCDIGYVREAALKLDRCHLPVCVVSVHGQTGLCLTGGGMDLSWEICEAYMRLGYLPPAHFAQHLPIYGRRGCSKKDRWILQGCMRAMRVARNFASNGLRNIMEIRQRTKQQQEPETVASS